MVSVRLSDNQIAALAMAAGWPNSEIPRAVAVCLAESNGETEAVSTTGDFGLWQINQAAHPTMSNLRDPTTNAQDAVQIWKDAGNSWSPWTTFKNGTYLIYMGRGMAAAAAPDKFGIPKPVGGTVNNAPTDTVTPSIFGPLANLTNGGFWLRVGAFLLGTIILVEALMRMTGANQTIIQFAKGAAKDAVAGAATA